MDVRQRCRASGKDCRGGLPPLLCPFPSMLGALGNPAEAPGCENAFRVSTPARVPTEEERKGSRARV